MRKIDMMPEGSTVIFTKKPIGSWLSLNVPYLVEVNSGNTAFFRNKETGGATFDKASDIETAEFSLVA